MKLSCCNKYIYILLFLYTTLFGAITDKSAIVYYGEDISYPMVGIHDYIIVQPSHTNTHTHGFDVYKNKMYAYVSIGEIDTDIPEYKKIKKSWILGKNRAWKSKILDLTNPEYKKFLFNKIIEPQMKRGFKNFFFDTLDSYQLVDKTDTQREKSKAALVDIIKTFHKKYPNSKLIINRGFEIIDSIADSINAVLFESYYNGVSGKNLAYKKVTDKDRKWLDIQINKIKKHKLDIICVDYLNPKDLKTKSKKLITDIKEKGMIPYISTRDLTTYGFSSKNPIKREILTLINTRYHDRMLQGAHQYGALPLEYMGYIEKLYDVKNPLPKIKNMQQYAGVIVWLTNYSKQPKKLINWLLKVKKAGIKIVFANNFAVADVHLLKQFNIEVQNFTKPNNNINKIVQKSDMMGYEFKPSLSYDGDYLKISTGKALYKIADKNGHTSTLAALMPWGGFAIGKSFIVTVGDDNIWAINPFKFFVKALRLKSLPVPDTTTENGKRLSLAHIDGDGFMNRVEWNPKLFSADIIYKKILKKYNLPISVSIVGAEVDNNGLYPKIAPQLQKIVKNIYKLPNVEPATHTFSHPFFWEKIKNGNLAPKYRLDPKGYKFSLDYETNGMLKELNTKYIPKEKPLRAHTLFWSGDCQPPENILAYVYKNKILNINGGDTYITNLHPWLSYIAPIGLGRGEYYQIYTGAQDENVYTNDWHGPFWGFRKVIQTFKLTNSPKRLKPIDIYYHYYSGSKRASLNALKDVYNWVEKQNIMPVYISEYISKAMDYYTVSISNDKKNYLINGMKDLKTVRLEGLKNYPDLNYSTNIIGFNDFETHRYVHLGKASKAILSLSKSNDNAYAYLVSSNGKIEQSSFNKYGFNLKLNSHVPLKIQLHIPKDCKYKLTSKASKITKKDDVVSLSYKYKKKVDLDVICRP
ncbi:endo alpha-1,4 polygalactosaminidase [Sulfurimonas sp.]